MIYQSCTIKLTTDLLKISAMTIAIETDPNTGLKKFSTRAAKATEKISGKGYSVINNIELTSLPEPPPGAIFNAEEQEKANTNSKSRTANSHRSIQTPDHAPQFSGVVIRICERTLSNTRTD